MSPTTELVDTRGGLVPVLWRARFVFATILVGGSIGIPTARAATTVTAVDTAAAAGLSYVGETWNAREVDADLDGHPDVWIGQHDQGSRLLAGDGAGAYVRVAPGFLPRANPNGKVPDRHDCVWGNFVGSADGSLPDAYCTGGRSSSNAVKTGRENQLWAQTSAGVFQDVATAMGVGDVCGRGHFAAVSDVNGDGWDDIFVGNALPRVVTGDPCDDPANGLPNEESKLFLNQGGGGFVDASAAYGIGGFMGARCAQAVDFDRDGRPDLMACRTSGIALWHNDGGVRFTEVSATSGVVPHAYLDAQIGDLNGDGIPDLVAVLPKQAVYQLGTGIGFGPLKRIVATSDGAAIELGDADGDGQRDVFLLRASVPRRTNPDDVILLNRGLTFTPVPVPAAGGIGDQVTALDGNRDGRSEFLVLNGAENATGPVQLIVVPPPVAGAGRRRA